MIGHRGAAGAAPENTLAGLRRAKALGCRWVEFDVRLTADGEAILLHDDRLERTTDGHGKASRLPMAAIRRCDAGSGFAPDFAGEPIPTLGEAVALLGELGLGANLELKAECADAAAVGRVAAGLLDRLWPADLPPPLFSSFAPEALAAVARRAPHFARGLLFRRIPRGWRRQAEALGCVSIHVDRRHLDPAGVAEIREKGYSVLAYTVNEPARARALWRWGVASVFSDVPHIISAAIGGDAAASAIAGRTASSGPGAVP